jgi:hypothetical protein
VHVTGGREPRASQPTRFREETHAEKPPRPRLLKRVATFFFPGLPHQPPTLTGTEDGLDQLLDALQGWTQHGKAPESFTEVTTSGEDLKVCAYPDKPVVTGYSGGNPVITCEHSDAVPPSQAAASATIWDKP